MKICGNCKVQKSFELFGRNSRSKDGMQRMCKECFCAYNAARYEAKKDQITEQINAYRQANPDRIKAWKSDWQASNRDKHRASCARYYETNREKILQFQAQYRTEYRAVVRVRQSSYKKRNPGEVRKHEALRRAAKMRATPKWADHKKIQAIYLEAARLTNETGVTYHVDHIVPLIGKRTKNGPQLVCGLHWEANLAVITGEENCSKGFYSWPDMP